MLDDNFWPSPEAFLDTSNLDQLTDGRARCTAVAVCDEAGRPARRFYQGQVAHFFYEFEILGKIDVPGGGLILCDAADYVIHGKNTFQFHTPAPQAVGPGMRLRYHHVICLDLGPGEYFFGVGLSSVDQESYNLYCQNLMPHSEFSGKARTHSSIPKISSLLVGLDQNGQLSHHGLTNLPGKCQAIVVELPMYSARDSSGTFPAILHLAHPEAGGDWLAHVFRACVPDRVVMPSAQACLVDELIQAGNVYPNVFVTRPEFDRLHLPGDWRRLVVIRDLRDTLVSAYLNFKASPSELQTKLWALNTEDGLVYLMDEWLPACAEFQLSWLEAGERLIHYEDLLIYDRLLEQVLIGDGGLPVSSAQLRKAIKTCQADKPNVETSVGTAEAGMIGLWKRYFTPLRKAIETRQADKPKVEASVGTAEAGMIGLWKKYFTPRVTDAFNVRYGDVLLNTGYETDAESLFHKTLVAKSVIKRPGRGLIYVASYPRSGNTWARNLIWHYLDRYVSSFYDEGGTLNLVINDDGSYGSPFCVYQTRQAPLMLCRTLRNRSGRVFSDQFRRHLAGSLERFFVKTHELPYESYFEGEGVIYLIRHPCAVFWSYYNYIRDHNLPGAAGLTLEDVIQGKVDFGSWSEHVERWLAAGRALGDHFVTFRYEDLATQETEFCRVASALSDLPVRAEPDSFPGFEQWRRRAPRLYRSANSQEWRRHFTPAHLDLVQALHGPTMARLGYTLDAG